MAKIPYLIRRKNVCYFRLGVPADLREIVKSREIIQSLRTQNSDEATRRALKLATAGQRLCGLFPQRSDAGVGQARPGQGDYAGGGICPTTGWCCQAGLRNQRGQALASRARRSIRPAQHARPRRRLILP